MSFVYGGLEGDRTLDLTDANRTLSQLSYEPRKTVVCEPVKRGEMQAFEILRYHRLPTEVRDWLREKQGFEFALVAQWSAKA